MKLSEKYRPTTLDDVVGQPPVRLLQAYCQNPYTTCFLLEGPPGVGKTAAAFAMANDLGCPDDMAGLHVRIASELGVDEARKLFESTLKLRPLMGCGRKVLIIEELETLSQQCSVFLKAVLDPITVPNLTVIATSNGAGKLTKPLLQRFTLLSFSDGKYFEEACQERLAAIWRAEFGDVDMPYGWQEWGRDRDGFSMRAALDQMQVASLLSGTVRTGKVKVA